MPNRVAVYMICKDEARFIERAVLSAAKADEIIVCDTGSTDDTLQKLTDLNLPNLKVHSIYVSPWRFDDARNTALSLVSTNIDLCVSLDADELLDAGFVEALQARDKDTGIVQINHSFKTEWSWDTAEPQSNVTKHFHERIHSRFGFRWVHPVHEKLTAREAITVAWMPVLMMIQRPDTSKNRSSYLPMLEQAVIEDPIDWKLWSFMAQEYVDRRLFAQADEALQKSLTCPDVDQVFIAWNRASLCLTQFKSEEAEVFYLDATTKAPKLREAWVKLADFYHSQGRTDDEAFALLRALKCTTETLGYRRIEAVWVNDAIEKRFNALQVNNDR